LGKLKNVKKVKSVTRVKKRKNVFFFNLWSGEELQGQYRVIYTPKKIKVEICA